MDKVIKCTVIGEASRAGSTRTRLEEHDIPTMALSHNAGTARIVQTCSQQKSLKIVAVFCRDFPMDWGASLFRALRKELGQKVCLHAFAEAKGKEKEAAVLRRFEEEGIELDEITFAFPVTPINAGAVISQKWFNGTRKRPRVAAPEDSEEPTAKQLATPVGVFRVTLPQSEVARSGNGVTVRTHLMEDKGPPLIPLVAQPPVAESAPEVAESVKHVATEHNKTLEAVLDAIPAFNPSATTMKRNVSFPPKPVVVSIAGKGGMVVAVDPRRIRLLPNQPRLRDSPGLAEESLRALGEGIKTLGQMEDVLVCPIVGDSRYDAQLIDGERRVRSAILAGVMVDVKVREDVTSEMTGKLYLLSVSRNDEKAPFTTREYVRIVARLRGSEFDMTRAEVGKRLNNRSQTWVMQMEHLGRLHPTVQEMLGEGDVEYPRGGKRRLTTNIALLLVDIETGKQLETAEHIVEKGMNYVQARRHVLNIRRGLGLTAGAGNQRRKARQFDALRTFASQNLVRLDTFLDMPTAELYSESRSDGERSGLCQDLLALAAKATEMAGRIQKV